MTSGNGKREEAPDPEVVPVAKRRHFSAKDKLRILEEADRCEYGEIGALVRREGIYNIVSEPLAAGAKTWAAGSAKSAEARSGVSG